MNAMTTLLPHLLRPWWLLALPALPLLVWLWRRRARAHTPWTQAVDAHLLPALLEEAPAARRSAASWLFALCYGIAVLALAGPAWRQPVATYTAQAPLVVVEDMSSHMLVADLPPSRLLRARLKVQQLIAQRKGGQIGLIAYAGDAFTVAPISDDAHSLDDLAVALTPDTMPVDGQRADLALRRAAGLLAHAGYPHGDILLLTDGADAAAEKAAREVHAKGYDVHVLGIGTTSGAPLPAADGTFVQDDKGGLRIARLDEPALRSLAAAGGGRYAAIETSSDDLAAIGALDPATSASATRASLDAVTWRDEGPWLLLALLPLAALGFRRGWLAVALLAVLAMPAQPVEAKPLDVWQNLWQRSDERADHALRAGDAQAAGALARTPAQRAAASYLKGDYAAAAAGWATLGDADADYNRGNALAQMQRYDEAIDAWQSALRKRPGMADAKANIDTVRRLRKQQPPEQKQQQQQDPSQQASSSRQDRKGQSSNQENMQRSQQQAQQQAGPQNRQQQASAKPPQPSDARQQGASQREDAGQQPKPDANRQAQADTAEKQALQQALQQRRKQEAGKPRQLPAARETTAESERREANQALMRRVADDPGSLLKRKFQLEYERRQQEGQQ